MHAGTSKGLQENGESSLTLEEAQAKIAEAVRMVDWVNLALVMDTLNRGFNWNKYDNAYHRPNFQRAEKDGKWVEKNGEKLGNALDVIRKNRNADN